MEKVFLNGRFVPLKDAKVSALDRGFLFGDGVFETMRSYGGPVFMLEDHMDRLFTSLKILGIKSPYPKKMLSRAVDKTLRKNKLENAYVKLIITRGMGPGGIDIPRKCSPTVLVYAKKLDVISGDIYKKGISVTLSCISRNKESFTSRIKSLNYVDAVLARAHARRDGFRDAIMVNNKGFIAEATTSNVFIVKRGSVITPPPTSGLLAGITRKAVMGFSGKYITGRTYEKDISPAELTRADEVFLTNSILELVPVVRIGRNKIGKGTPGPFYKVLHALYKVRAANKEVSHV